MKIFKNLFGNGSKIHADEIAVAPGLLLGSAAIIESGVDTNGKYIKFGDGTMICFGRYPIIESVPIVNPYYGFYYGSVDIPYPRPFVGDVAGNVVSSSILSSMSNFGSAGIIWYPALVTSATVHLSNVSWFAVGRWK